MAIVQVLKEEGYIDGFRVKTEDGKSELEISLKYYAGRPVIERIERVSRPGLRVYKGHDAIPQVMNGLGVAIVTTPQRCDDRSQSTRHGRGRRSSLLRGLRE
jgi:small subunit ribosomal protein S8